MQRIMMAVVLVGALTVWLAAPVCGATQKWDLSGVSKIRLDGVSGDVTIVPADGKNGRLELRSAVRPDDAFEARVDEDGGTVRIKEKWWGNSSGSVSWTIYVTKTSRPLSVRVSNASGDLDCRDVAVHVDFNTASGDIRLENVKLAEDSRFNTASGDYVIEDMTVSEDTKFSTASGDMELRRLEIEDDCKFSSASGDVIVKDCVCGDDVSFSSASGDVVVSETEAKGECDFSSASGDVEVVFDRLPKRGLHASSASGRVTLDVRNFGSDFTLVLIKRKDKGRISCPFEYTDETEYEDHHVYVKKIVKKGSGRPEIVLKTASGKVVVKD